MADPKNAAHRVSIKCICIAEDKVLMLHFIDRHRTLVGGGVDKGESIEAAMKREFFEETGKILDDILIPKLHHLEIEQYDTEGKFSAVVNIYYILHFDKPFDVVLEDGVYSGYKRATVHEMISLESQFNKDVVIEAMK